VDRRCSDEDLCIIPDTIDMQPPRHASRLSDGADYLTQEGKKDEAPAIGGAVGNAVPSWPRAGRGESDFDDDQPRQAEQARALGFDNVVDLSAESLTDGSLADGGRGVDIVIDRVGGALTGHALATLPRCVLTSLGYSAGRETTIDLTDLIWRRANMSGFSLFRSIALRESRRMAAILPLLTSGR